MVNVLSSVVVTCVPAVAREFAVFNVSGIVVYAFTHTHGSCRVPGTANLVWICCHGPLYYQYVFVVKGVNIIDMPLYAAA